MGELRGSTRNQQFRPLQTGDFFLVRHPTKEMVLLRLGKYVQRVNNETIKVCLSCKPPSIYDDILQISYMFRYLPIRYSGSTTKRELKVGSVLGKRQMIGLETS